MTTSSKMHKRLDTLAAGLGISVANDMGWAELIDSVAYGLTADNRSRMWLTLAVLNAQFPLQDEYDIFYRAVLTAGPHKAIRRLIDAAMRVGSRTTHTAAEICIVHNAVIVDVNHTATTGLATGIQRVVRQTMRVWSHTHDIELVGWDSKFDGLRLLSDHERENALWGTQPDAEQPSHSTMIIPVNSHYILPELVAEKIRTSRLACFARESGNHTSAIGYDCVPLTSPETVGEGMGVLFSYNLATLRHFDRISVTSEAARSEYAGWRKMLSGAGWSGPSQIKSIPLAVDVVEVSDEQITAVRETLQLGELPLVLCVGSHEPRKNHLAVLYAAEVLWREGLKFALVFIGGNAWNSKMFRSQLKSLVKRGRPVSSISAISDDLLWSAYRIADITVFPSLNEGFGLPILESLAVGTPVITSCFGSMREVGEGGGTVFIDPRDDDDLVRALRELLTDEQQRQRLASEATGREYKTWEEYADELWDFFVTSS